MCRCRNDVCRGCCRQRMCDMDWWERDDRRQRGGFLLRQLAMAGRSTEIPLATLRRVVGIKTFRQAFFLVRLEGMMERRYFLWLLLILLRGGGASLTRLAVRIMLLKLLLLLFRRSWLWRCDVCKGELRGLWHSCDGGHDCGLPPLVESQVSFELRITTR